MILPAESMNPNFLPFKTYISFYLNLPLPHNQFSGFPYLSYQSTPIFSPVLLLALLPMSPPVVSITPF